MKTLTALLSALLLSLSFMTGIAHAGDKQKVVYHVNGYDKKQQIGALRNIQNHINAVGAENLDLRVVMHGNGLSLLLTPDGMEGTKMKGANADDDMAARIDGLKSQGIGFKVCANTLKGRKIPMDALYGAEDSDIVPSGVAELGKLQAEGFAYIKP